MDRIFEIVLTCIMFLFDLLILFMGIAVWWTLAAFITKFVISVFFILTSIAFGCLTAWLFLSGL